MTSLKNIYNILLHNFYVKFGFYNKVVNEEIIPKDIFKKFLPQNPVIIDCGAFDGNDSIALQKTLHATLHCFEPVPEIFSILKKNTENNNNIHCYNLALGNETTTKYLYKSEGVSKASSSLLEPKEHLIDHPDTSFENKILVNVTTIDKWAEDNQIEKVDMLWLDMQGYELQTLKASKKILSTVSVIHTEVSVKETYHGVDQYQAVKSFLENNGFEVLIEAIPAGWDMGNVVFLKKNNK